MLLEKTVAVLLSFAFRATPCPFSLKMRHTSILLAHFNPFLILRLLRNRLSSYRRMASPAKETDVELVDTNYDPEESE